MAESDEQLIEQMAGRSAGQRADSRTTHARLIDAVNDWVATHNSAPTRLADLAELAGVATATAYRHFSSVDDAILAFALRLPVRAVELFESADDPSLDAATRLGCWNTSWVASCIEHGPIAVNIRSPRGFLERRNSGDPLISYACSHIEPLLDQLEGDTVLQLFTWNVTSDPREVIDLMAIGWTPTQIADFVTASVLTTPPTPGR